MCISSDMFCNFGILAYTLKQILTESFKMTHIILKLIIMTQSWVDLTNITSKIHFAPNWRTLNRVKMTFSQWVKYRWVVLTWRVGARWHANLWYCWLWIILTQNINLDPFLFWPASHSTHLASVSRPRLRN